MITQERLKELLHYNPDTGIFTWKEYRSGVKSDGYAGCIDAKGYKRITISYILYAAHRLAWMYMNGSFPESQIDHINGIPGDNRIRNLRSVSCSENLRNQKRRILNTSGCMGVYWYKSNSKWGAGIRVNRKNIHLGLYDDWFDAVCARKSAESKFNFHENHGRS